MSVSQESTQSALIAHFTTGVCQVGSAMFPLGEIAFFDALINLVFYDTNSTATTILSIEYNSFLSFKIVKTIKSFRMRLPTEAVLPWIIHNKFPAESSQLDYFTISIALDDESFQLFLQQTAPFLAASHARARSASHMTMLPEPIPVDLQEIRARQEAIDAARLAQQQQHQQQHDADAAEGEGEGGGGYANAEEGCDELDHNAAADEVHDGEEGEGGGVQYYQDEEGNIYVMDPNAPPQEEGEEGADVDDAAAEYAAAEEGDAEAAPADADADGCDDALDGPPAVGEEADPSPEGEGEEEEKQQLHDADNAEADADDEDPALSAPPTARASSATRRRRGGRSSHGRRRGEEDEEEADTGATHHVEALPPNPSHSAGAGSAERGHAGVTAADLLDDPSIVSPSCPTLSRSAASRMTARGGASSSTRKSRSVAVRDMTASSCPPTAVGDDEDAVAAAAEDANTQMSDVADNNDCAAPPVRATSSHGNGRSQKRGEEVRGKSASRRAVVAQQQQHQHVADGDNSDNDNANTADAAEEEGAPMRRATVQGSGAACPEAASQRDESAAPAVVVRGTHNRSRGAVDGKGTGSDATKKGAGAASKAAPSSSSRAASSAKKSAAAPPPHPKRSGGGASTARRDADADDEDGDDDNTTISAILKRSKTVMGTIMMMNSSNARAADYANESRQKSCSVMTTANNHCPTTTSTAAGPALGRGSAGRKGVAATVASVSPAQSEASSAASSQHQKRLRRGDDDTIAANNNAKDTDASSSSKGGAAALLASPSSCDDVFDFEIDTMFGRDIIHKFAPTAAAAAPSNGGNAAKRGGRGGGKKGAAAAAGEKANAAGGSSTRKGRASAAATAHKADEEDDAFFSSTSPAGGKTKSLAASTAASAASARRRQDTTTPHRPTSTSTTSDKAPPTAAAARQPSSSAAAAAGSGGLPRTDPHRPNQNSGTAAAAAAAASNNLLAVAAVSGGSGKRGRELVYDDDDDDARSSAADSDATVDIDGAAMAADDLPSSPVNLFDGAANATRKGAGSVRGGGEDAAFSAVTKRCQSEARLREAIAGVQNSTSKSTNSIGIGSSTATAQRKSVPANTFTVGHMMMAEPRCAAADAASQDVGGELSAMLAHGLSDDASLDDFLKKAQQLVRKKKVEKRARAQSQAPAEVCKAAHDLVGAYCEKVSTHRDDFFASHQKRVGALAAHAETLRKEKVRLVETVNDGLATVSEAVDVVIACIERITERLEQNKKVWAAADTEDQTAVLGALQQRIEQQQQIMQKMMVM